MASGCFSVTFARHVTPAGWHPADGGRHDAPLRARSAHASQRLSRRCARRDGPPASAPAEHPDALRRASRRRARPVGALPMAPLLTSPRVSSYLLESPHISSNLLHSPRISPNLARSPSNLPISTSPLLFPHHPGALPMAPHLLRVQAAAKRRGGLRSGALDDH